MAGRASYLDVPIGILYTLSNRQNSKKRLKIVRNYTIDQLIERNYTIPGVPEKAIILEVVVGSKLCDKLEQKVTV